MSLEMKFCSAFVVASSGDQVLRVVSQREHNSDRAGGARRRESACCTGNVAFREVGVLPGCVRAFRKIGRWPENGVLSLSAVRPARQARTVGVCLASCASLRPTSCTNPFSQGLLAEDGLFEVAKGPVWLSSY